MWSGYAEAWQLIRFSFVIQDAWLNINPRDSHFKLWKLYHKVLSFCAVVLDYWPWLWVKTEISYQNGFHPNYIYVVCRDKRGVNIQSILHHHSRMRFSDFNLGGQLISCGSFASDKITASGESEQKLHVDGFILTYILLIISGLILTSALLIYPIQDWHGQLFIYSHI